MNTNVTSITKALLNRKPACCDHTIEAHPDCTGWFADGWAWHPESTCQQCGAPNINWWIDSDRWNTATTDLDNGRGAILCPSCFVRLHETHTGLVCTWTLTPTIFRPVEAAIAARDAEKAEWEAQRGADTTRNGEH